MNLNLAIDRFRLIAILEGISFLLFAITMPLKYGLDITTPNYVVGIAHGFLFIAYIVACIQAVYIYQWSLKTMLILLIASLIPAGTFLADVKIIRPERDRILSSY